MEIIAVAVVVILIIIGYALNLDSLNSKVRFLETRISKLERKNEN